MNSSRNPKVINHTLRDKLNPLLARVEALGEQDTTLRKFIEDTKAAAAANISTVNAQVGEYNEAAAELVTSISTDNQLLTDLIVGNLINPNLASNPGEDDPTVPANTKLITDKTVTALAYGFVINGTNMALAGAVNKGLCIGIDPVEGAEFIFKNPEDSSFPSFYINDIMRVSTSRSYLATNAGFADYDLATSTYSLRESSSGMPADIITRLLSVKNSDGSLSGILAGTAKGLAYSATTERWNVINEAFESEVTCFTKTETPSVKQTRVLVGTPKGIYFVDMDAYLNNGDTSVHYLEAITALLPSWYIYCLGYNTSTDELYIGTDSGVTVIKNFSVYLTAGNFAVAPASISTYSVAAGLSGSLCFDILVTASGRVIIATSNGLTITSNFKDFTYITRRQTGVVNSTGLLKSFMCRRLIRKDNTLFTVVHPSGLTEGLSM